MYFTSLSCFLWMNYFLYQFQVFGRDILLLVKQYWSLPLFVLAAHCLVLHNYWDRICVVTFCRSYIPFLFLLLKMLIEDFLYIDLSWQISTLNSIFNKYQNISVELFPIDALLAQYWCPAIFDHPLVFCLTHLDMFKTVNRQFDFFFFKWVTLCGQKGFLRTVL